VLEAAPKPSPVDSAFRGCGPAGSPPDRVLNRLKNRVDEGDYIPVPWTVVAHLPWPRVVGYRFCRRWTKGERKAVAPYEGAAVRVEGYAAAYKLEVREPPNCYSPDPSNRDFHLWLSERARKPEKRSIVVEITPRVRASHPQWTAQHLAALVASRARVRVSGWLMLDQMHPELVGRNRVTLWEVHPVMRLEWQRADSSWVPLDSLAPPARADTVAGGISGGEAAPPHSPDRAKRSRGRRAAREQ
jgi:hypothetical protein